MPSNYGLELLIKNYNFVPEYKFCSSRRWRFDYAILEHKIAIEIEGGIFTQGRHTRGKGFSGDMEKYNEAVKSGWSVLRYTPQQINDIIFDIEILLNNRKHNG
ncbi:MAG: endonuclease domain-containing protein [Spirochaetota bacterium]|nr:endonuclease domain-containing protein [Spirochaetota bacterium]